MPTWQVQLLSLLLQWLFFLPLWVRKPGLNGHQGNAEQTPSGSRPAGT